MQGARGIERKRCYMNVIAGMLGHKRTPHAPAAGSICHNPGHTQNGQACCTACGKAVSKNNAVQR